jgi:hypothetical protein
MVRGTATAVLRLGGMALPWLAAPGAFISQSDDFALAFSGFRCVISILARTHSLGRVNV